MTHPAPNVPVPTAVDPRLARLLTVGTGAPLTLSVPTLAGSVKLPLPVVLLPVDEFEYEPAMTLRAKPMPGAPWCEYE